MTARLFALLVLIGALLDVAVFAFQVDLASNQQRINAKTECWAAVLDGAVKHRPTTTAERAALVKSAQKCVRLKGAN